MDNRAEAVSSGAEKVGEFAQDTAHRAKLKLDVHHLRNKLEEIYSESGKKLWHLHHDQKLNEVEAIFAETFKEIDKLQEAIETKEKEEEAI